MTQSSRFWRLVSTTGLHLGVWQEVAFALTAFNLTVKWNYSLVHIQCPESKFFLHWQSFLLLFLVLFKLHFSKSLLRKRAFKWLSTSSIVYPNFCVCKYFSLWTDYCILKIVTSSMITWNRTSCNYQLFPCQLLATACCIHTKAEGPKEMDELEVQQKESCVPAELWTFTQLT